MDSGPLPCSKACIKSKVVLKKANIQSMKKKKSNAGAKPLVTVNLYSRRAGRNLPSDMKVSLAHDASEDIILQQGTKRSTLSTFQHNGFRLMGIGSTVRENETLVAAPIQIPSFFEEMPGAMRANGAYSGIFLAKIKGSFSLGKSGKKSNPQKSALASFADPVCKGKGSHDCPYLMLLGTSKNEISHFTFNGQVFFPLLTRAFTIIYYAADESSEAYNWDHPNYSGIKDPNGFVAVNGPICYDPVLGIFITRNASIALP